MVKLLKFSHNRKAPFKQSCDDLRDVIDGFAEQAELADWYDYFKNNYSLPGDVIKQAVKRYLEGEYHYQRGVFSEKLFLKKGLLMVIRHIGFLLYTLFTSKKPARVVKTYKLIVEWIATNIELLRFSELVNLFNKQNVLIIAVSPVTEAGYKILYRPKYKFYDRKEVIGTFFKEITHGLKLYLSLSIKLKVNLMPIATYIINEYLYYSSIFRHNRSKYCIQERHYQTSAVKNFLFHKYGGKCSASIQKNIHLLGRSGFYHDIDVLFSLGHKTAGRAFEYGGRIKQLVPVGSMFMEYYWFGNERNKRMLNKEYDIVYLGQNISKALYFVDAYESFKDDYYGIFRWLADFSRRNPHLRIGIKHHGDNKIDPRETEIIKDTSIETIDQNLNSYKVAFQSKCVVTYGSTMGYELLAHGLPALFLDPGGRCALLPDPDDPFLSSYRAYNYQDFSDKVARMLSGQYFEGKKFDAGDVCLNSQHVSERIFSWFSSNAGE